jgi:uncharacterized protein (DUF302 family)
MRTFVAILMFMSCVASGSGWFSAASLHAETFIVKDPTYVEGGLVMRKSAHSVNETLDRLETLLKAKDMTVFIRIDHAKAASKVGRALRPTELLIFGNPKTGTPLMQCRQTAAIDLPQKALAWEDEAGQVWLTYNDPRYLAHRHGMEGCGETIRIIVEALSNFVKAAATPSPGGN